MKFNHVFQLLIFGSVAVALLSCDPVQVITLKSTPGTKSSVCVYGDGFIDMNSTYPNHDSTQVVICVPNQDTTSTYETRLFFGIGGWSDPELDELIEHIDSIVLVKSNLKSNSIKKDELEVFFRTRLSGMARNLITIEAE